MHSEFTLAKAGLKVRQSETVKKQQSLFHEASAAEQTKWQTVSPKCRQAHRGQKPHSSHSYVLSQSKGCRRCGNFKSHNWRDCPAKEDSTVLEKKGHFAKVCRSSQTVDNISDTDSDDCAFLGELKAQDKNDWAQVIHLNGEQI